MSDPKGHHYLPICYLENFSVNSKIWDNDRYTKSFINSKTKNVFKQNYYYAISNDDVSKDNRVEKN